MQQVEIASVKLGPQDPKKRKGVLVGGIVAVVAIVAISLSIFAVKQHNKAVARAEYIENLQSVRLTMLSGAAKAESLCNLTKSVWYNTIHKKSDPATNMYTKNEYSGNFHDSFDTSLKYLYRDESTKTEVSAIKENQDKVAEIIKSLQNPTDELESCYETVDNMYDAYQGLTRLAVSPSGSLTTYSANFSAYDSDFMKYYDKLDAQIPDK